MTKVPRFVEPRTFVKVLAHFTGQARDAFGFSLLLVRIGTGRRHQIRSHLAEALGHPLVCDGKYGNDRFAEDRLP
eukprot:Skav211152  [mRNA]  locus=scaffold413:297410:298114:+ [translate_table: standard]